MLILASQSPRRRELLARAGLSFEVRPPHIEEVRRAGESAESYVVRLARGKALAAAAAASDWVVGADTTVVVDEAILEKPRSDDDAVRMLRLLSGRWHEVLTGVCLRRGGETWAACESTRVHFLSMSDSEIAAYVATGEPADKAGAYAIQGIASRYIDRVEGCYLNVVGLPVSRLWRLLKDAGYSPALG
ncbi:MAG: septum formation inhibitor Maf [Bryobacterales bacterium]|nr:septum formation inhibitor Maf [Bryobacterales bacterium]